MDIELADTMPDGWQLWVDWHKLVAPENQIEIRAVESDRGEYLGYVRMVSANSMSTIPVRNGLF